MLLWFPISKKNSSLNFQGTVFIKLISQAIIKASLLYQLHESRHWIDSHQRL